MFGDQTSSNIVGWPNMLMLKWVAKRLKHVWSNTISNSTRKEYGPQISQSEISIWRNVRLRRLGFKLKKSIVAIILLEILEEDGKRESRQGRTSGWIRKREEKGSFNDAVQELMIEDTRGYREMMRMTHDSWFSRVTAAYGTWHNPSYAVGMSSFSCIISFRKLYPACLLRDILLKIHPIGMHFVPINQSKDSFLCRSISLPFLCFRLRLSVSSVTISPFSTTSTKASSSFAPFKTLKKRRT